jgi:NAD(P)-dependent dehydrogenase (short-subunit alcohol dehydrogenase family)
MDSHSRLIDESLMAVREQMKRLRGSDEARMCHSRTSTREHYPGVMSTKVLDSKIIVVTGGSLGIGFEVARLCAAHGASVVLAARGRTDLNAALGKLERIPGQKYESYPLDVADDAQVETFARWCATHFGRIHGLVNCAGVLGPIGKTHEVSMAEFSAAVRINLLGTVYMCHAFVPLLNSEGRSKIVNYSGGGAATPFPNFSAYAASKIGIVRFTENLSMELADRACDVNCVAPGFVITRLHQQTLSAGPGAATRQYFEKTRKQLESGGVPPEKAARLTVFLLSAESDGITGKFISAPWDPWQVSAFQQRLRTDRDFATLRRIDDKQFCMRW